VSTHAQFGGYQTPNPSVDQYRSQIRLDGSPVPSNAQMAPNAHNQGLYGAPGFGMPAGPNGFGYGGMNGMPYMQDHGNNRRGRVGYNQHVYE
jgi:protein JSN1